MQISPQAVEKISKFISGYDDPKVRIAQVTVGGGCCAKMQLGVTLEEDVEDEDELFVVDGISFVIDRALKEGLGEIVVDFSLEQGIVVRGTSAGA
jgi:Fe-S cluster assembly iron-binding protein IscA